MRFLVTNDDGIAAPGLVALCQELCRAGEVLVVAPERQRSSSSHSITLHKPIRVRRHHFSDGVTAYSSSGTPSDCVALGLGNLAPGPTDFVVAGINEGANLGIDVTYSGTVMAALEGCLKGVTGIAVSAAGWGQPPNFKTAAAFARRLCERLKEHPLPPGTLLNVNVPPVCEAEIAGVSLTRLGNRRYEFGLQERRDPWDKPYFWRGKLIADTEFEPGTDEYAVAHNFISVTPLLVDLTAHSLLTALENLDLPSLWNKPPRS